MKKYAVVLKSIVVILVNTILKSLNRASGYIIIMTMIMNVHLASLGLMEMSKCL